MRAEKLRNVIYACDDKYIKQTIVSLVSLLEHNRYPIKVWVVSDGIISSNKDLILEIIRGYKVELTFIEIEDILKDINLVNGQRHTRTIYVKLFLEDFIKADKLLYLDSDTIINCDIEYLWKRDMSEELIAGVKMPYSIQKKELLNISPSQPYLCDGIIMLNLDLWRINKIGYKCKEYIKRYMGDPPMMSEGTINYICQNNIGVLPPEFNLMPFMIMYSAEEIKKLFCINDYYNEHELAIARNQPIIIHYIKELYNRPWFEPCDHPYKAIYREKCELLFGEEQYKAVHLDTHTKFTRFLLCILPFCIFTFLYHLKERLRKKL